MSTQKQCLYEVLGLSETCTQDEIRAAYKKLALQRHPDKLIRSGLSPDDATASFQELVNAYEVLSDPKERKWYDSHRSQILFSSPSESDSTIPDLFPYFSPSCYTGFTNSKTGFYKVYGDLFNKIYANEVKFAKVMGLSLGLVKEAPLMGDVKSPHAQVKAFYGYWLGFSTVMDFAWADEYVAPAWGGRKERRKVEEENKKLRKKEKKEFNDMVRRLAEFVKKRDKRMLDMIKSKEQEMEKKRAEELERRKKMEKEKLEKARMYEVPEWANIDEVEMEEFEEEDDAGKEDKKKELYCVACGKKFKSEKQWKNHEQSKKHKEKVAQLRETFEEEDDLLDVEQTVEDEFEELEGDATKGDMEAGNSNEEDACSGDFVSADELEEKFRGSLGLENEESEDESQVRDEEGIDNIEDSIEVESNDESSVLEAMMSGHKGRKYVPSDTQSKASASNDNTYDSDEDLEFANFNNRKGCTKSRRNKKHKDRTESMGGNDGDDASVPCVDNNDQGVSDFTADPVIEETNREELMTYANKKGNKKSRRAKKGRNLGGKPTMVNDGDNKGDDNVRSEEHTVTDPSDMITGTVDEAISDAERSASSGNQAAGKKGSSKREVDTRAKNATKGRKQKGKSKSSAQTCEKCGEEFESRNRLHKHLHESGHALIKSR